MEPFRTTFDDGAKNSNSRVLSIPLIKCDDRVLNGIIKQEITDETDHHNDSQLLQKGSRVEPFPLNIICGDQVFDVINEHENIDGQAFNRIIKQEIIDETDHHNDSQLLQKGSRVEPFPLNIICGNQVFDVINKQENIDGQAFNRIIKQEIIDETDDHNDSQLLQKGSRVEPFPLNITCGDQVFDVINKQENSDGQAFNRIIKQEIIDETDHHNDSQLLQKGSRVEPFPPYIICGDQVFDVINKQENIDGQAFNRIIKQEIIDETDHHNDSQLLQKGSRVEPFPLNIICGDQVFDVINKQEDIDGQAFNRIIKQEIIDETDQHNDSQLLQKGSRVEPFPLNIICGDQVFDVINKQEDIDGQAFNRIIKQEIIDETDQHNDSQLLQNGSRVEPFPLNIICGDQVFDVINKQEDIDGQVFNGIIKQEIIDETDQHNDSQLLQNGSRVEPFPLNIICGDQVFDVINKQEDIDGQVFNGIIKQEIIDETDQHNDSQLLQNGTKIEEKGNEIDTEMKEDFIGDQEFKGTVLNENHSSEFTTCINSDKTSNSLRESPLNDICDKISIASYLTAQKSTHNKKKLNKCGICGIPFSKASDLARHIRTHTREKPYRCDICDRSFTRASVLRKHNRKHAEEHSFKCEVCGMPFSEESHLTLHTSMHTEERPYRCDICDFRFSKSSHLTRHKMTHTQEKPYVCDFCEKAFAQRYNLTKHKRRHTIGKPYKCNICGTQFADASNLTKHGIRSHSETLSL
ncbi:hypothetical protein QTP88_002501 [Uroleucon formosanum]